MARWIETMLPHAEGDVQGQPMRLSPFQKYILNRKYEYHPSTGRLLYDRCLFGLPKGNAKTELMGADADAELAGPISPTSPNVVVSAASWEQANRLYGAARMMLETGPLRGVFEGHVYDDHITRPDRPGILSRIAAIAGTNDGGLPTAHYGDEVHEWEGERRERVYVVMGNGLKKRTPRAVLPDGRVRLGAQQVGITTAGDDKDSLLGKLYDHGVGVAQGTIIDPSYLFLWWEAEDIYDLDTDDGLMAALIAANPAVGAFLSLDNLAQRFRDPTTARYEVERYHLNRWKTAPDAWIGLDRWMSLRAKAPLGHLVSEPGMKQPPDGAEVCLGFYGAAGRSSAALVGCTLQGHAFVVGIWDRGGKAPEWVVPRSDVDERVAMAFGRWNVKRLTAHPARWESEVETWATAYGTTRVLALDTFVMARFAPACGRLSDAVVDEPPRMTHDGDPRLARHVANARVRETRWGLVIAREDPDSPRVIDGAAALVLAYDGVAGAPVAPSASRTLHTW